MKVISKYFYVLILSKLAALSLLAQTDTNHLKIHVGTDIAIPVTSLIYKGYSGGSLVVDAEVFDNILFVFETGIQTYAIRKQVYDYNASGNFIKPGIDLNIFRKPHNNSQVLIGFRYAYATFDHSLPRLEANNYWGRQQLTFDSENINAHWFELLGGLRIEVFRHIFFGWTLRVQFPEWTNKNTFTPLYIPGYNKNNNKAGVGFTYTVTYSFGH